MSFAFTWPDFSPEFYASAKSMLDSALNRGPKPKVIADDIHVEKLSMGTVPPDLDILEIGDLSKDRFRGIFRLTYAGDAHIVLSTKVQANPLSSGGSNGSASSAAATHASFMGASHSDTFAPFGPSATSAAASAASSSHGRGILFAATPLIVPMRLTLSHVRLRAIIVLVVSKTKGITLVFKNDPLESVQVSSTFDSVAVLAKYLQQEIEGQLKEVFREDLPGIIHRLSQKWLSSRNSAKKGPTAPDVPNRERTPSPPPTQRKPNSPSSRKAQSTAASSSARRARKSAASTNAAKATVDGSDPLDPTSKVYSPSQRKSRGRRSGSPSANGKHRGDESEDSSSTSSSSSSVDIPPPLSDYYNNDLGLAGGIEAYDPTYGLRPDEVRVPKDGRGFRNLKALKKSLERSKTDRAKTTDNMAQKKPLARKRGTAMGLGGLLLPEAGTTDADRQDESDVSPGLSDIARQSDVEDDFEQAFRRTGSEAGASSHSPAEEDEIQLAQNDGDEMDFPNERLRGEAGRRPASSSHSSGSEARGQAGHLAPHSISPSLLDDYASLGIGPSDDPFHVAFAQMSSAADSARPEEPSRLRQQKGETAPVRSESLARTKSSPAKSAAESKAAKSVRSEKKKAPSTSSKDNRNAAMRSSSSHTGVSLIPPPAPVSKAGSAHSSSSSRPRPRIFHSSSLLRISDPFGGAGGAGSVSHAGSAFSGAASPERYGSGAGYAGSSHPGSMWGHRSTGTGGSATIRGAPRSSAGGGSGAAHDEGTSTVGKGRMFRIRSKEERERDKWQELYGDGIDGHHPSTRGPSSRSKQSDIAREGEDWDEEEEEEEPHSSSDAQFTRGVERNADRSSSPSGSGSVSGSRSRWAKSSFSVPRTLATLDPEPVDSSVYDARYSAAKPGQGRATEAFANSTRQGNSKTAKTYQDRVPNGGTRPGLGSRGLYRLGYGEDDD